MALKTIKKLCPSSKYNRKCPYKMTPSYITIHNTANDASARNEVNYMLSNNNQTSYHFAVDDKEAIQAIPLTRNAWHAGDGNGTGNRKSIGIEICYSKSGGKKFDQAEKNAAYLTATLLKKYGWGINRVKRHKDWSGKDCPHRTIDRGWNRFLNMVEDELGQLTILSFTDKNYWYFRYPFTTMGISQDYDGSYSHKKYSTGNRKDYPIDEAGSDTGRDWMYAMNDLVVKRIYGVNNSKQPNTIWLQTKNKVVTPLGIGYVTFRATHMSDTDIKKYRVGQVIKHGTKMFREGVDGGASGNHIHMTFAEGTYKSPGWKENNKGAFVLTASGNNRKPEKILFIDSEFTKRIRMTQGLKFKTKPKRKNMTTKKKVKVRKSYSVKASQIGTISAGKKVTVYVTRGNWYCIGPNMWVYAKYLK